ncbi:four-carbon acid sugar kinase family protein [Mesorhizobium sp. WSM3876]|uniref:four-carbon acid sugar kinase family protein n=1 Tax=Mesorhizobium sp. WSM3876 TaxID=422277 RepID=UPI001FE197AC|nr:four-carbon acid sugar kinase family protein [Mesorhizobium sp. WSM3876]
MMWPPPLGRAAIFMPMSISSDAALKPSLGIIADDYTGALMVACYLEAAGIYAPLVFDAKAAVPGARVIVAGTRTRLAPVEEALSDIKAIADAFTQLGYSRLSYKTSAGFDSTERGNIGPVADYLADRQGIRPVVMAAGFPEFNITTHQGYLFYRGRLVSESIKRFDPLTPMSDPDLVRFLSRQTTHGVGLINHIQMRQGPQAVALAADALAGAGNGHIFFDISDDEDIEIAARFAIARELVVVASDPFAVEYTKMLASGEGPQKPAPHHAKGPAAVLAGTVGPVILRQLEAFAKTYPVLSLDLLDPRGSEAVIGGALAWADQHIGAQPFAISTANDAGAAERAQAAFGPIAAARKAEYILASIASALRDRGIRRFVVAGGETSGAVVRSLGIGAVRAFAEGPIGTGFCVAEGPDPISLFLKPGKHGGDDILIQALDHMV